MNIEQVIQELQEKLSELPAKMSTRDIVGTYGIIAAVIACVEEYAIEISSLTGAQKKEIALNMLSARIDIPFVPGFVERPVLSWIIDLIVEVYNAHFSKNWLTSLKP